MVKHTQASCQQFADELFECDHFLMLALKGLNLKSFAEAYSELC